MFGKYELGLSSNIFTVVMPNGTFYPEHIGIEDERIDQFISRYDAIRDKPWEQCVFLDLGCGEGSSALGIGRTGARVIGIDGREDVISRACFARDQYGYANVEFYVGNVLDEALWEQVDAVFMAGLIHHLENPLSLIDLLEKYCRSMVFMCTHVAPDDEAHRTASHFSRLLFDPSEKEYRGNRIAGMCFHEDADLREERDIKRRHPRSGVGNTFSWWPSRAGLEQAMASVGFVQSQLVTKSDYRLRFRYVFYRQQEESHPGVVDQEQFLWPVIPRPDYVAAATRSVISDRMFMKQQNISPLVVGDQTSVQKVVQLLRNVDIEGNGMVRDGGDDRSDILSGPEASYVVLAASSYGGLKSLYDEAMLYKNIRYAFTSFSLVSLACFSDVVHPVFGSTLHVGASHGGVCY